MEILKVELHLSTAFHPQTDGQTERMNRIIEDCLRHYVNSNLTNWDTLLPQMEFAINSAWQESIRCTPFYANYGYHPRSPLDLKLRQLRKLDVPAADSFANHMQKILQDTKRAYQQASERSKQVYDKGRKPLQFAVGDRVLLNTANINLRTPKGSKGDKHLLPRWIGPFTVTERIGEKWHKPVLAYRLDLPQILQIHPVFHVNVLKRYKEGGRVKPPQPRFNAQSNEVYEVEAVIDHRPAVGFNDPQNKRKRKYLIHWAYFGVEHRSWEPAANVEPTAAQAVQAYWQMRARHTVYPH